MSKAHRKAKRPNIAPAALLRARLETAWLGPAAGQWPAEQLEAALQAASRGLKPEVAASTALSAFAAAPPEVQAKLETVLPAWLARQNSLEMLAAWVGRGELNPKLQEIARRWLAAAGQSVPTLSPSAEGTFHSAYLLEGEWQSAVIVLWYTNAQRSRTRGMEFLIDGNPPWDGAVKDVMLFPNKPPERLIQHYVDMWEERGQAMTPIAAAALKRRLVIALKRNEAAQIRLPADLIALREEFIAHVLTLPDGPRTPAFSLEDFQRLSETGQSAEAVSRFEDTVARRIRLDNGQEVFVDPSLAHLGFDDWDAADA